MTLAVMNVVQEEHARDLTVLTVLENVTLG
jgi:hypothetical protein